MTDTSQNVTPFNEIARLAEKQGLKASTDSEGRYYLTLADRPESAPGKISLNPHLVLHAVSKSEALEYLRNHRGPHREIGPGEALDRIYRPESDD